MNKQKHKTRTYKLELIPVFWNFLMLLLIFFGFFLLAIYVHYLFVIPLGIYLLLIGIVQEKFIFLKRKRTIKLHQGYLEIVETKQKIDFHKVVWFRVDQHFRTPIINFLLKEKGKFWTTSFAIVDGSSTYQTWKGFKNTSIRRIKQTNPNSLVYWETLQGKIVKTIDYGLFVCMMLIVVYKHPFLMIGLTVFLVGLVYWIFKK